MAVIPEKRQGVANSSEARPLLLIMIKSNNTYLQFMGAMNDIIIHKHIFLNVCLLMTSRCLSILYSNSESGMVCYRCGLVIWVALFCALPLQPVR